MFDQTDFDPFFKGLLSHFLYQNHSVDTSHGRNKTDAEKFRNEVIKVFIQNDFDISSKIEV